MLRNILVRYGLLGGRWTIDSLQRRMFILAGTTCLQGGDVIRKPIDARFLLFGLDSIRLSAALTVSLGEKPAIRTNSRASVGCLGRFAG